MHVVAVVALDGVVGFDLATPCELFPSVRLQDGRPGYQVRVCGVAKRVQAGAFDICAPFALSELEQADTIVIPGVRDVSATQPPALLRALVRAAERGKRIMSICTGAFVLAEAGLLDGLRATTHWLASAQLSRRYPAVRVDPEVLYVDEGQILTSAGAAAGLDLCLHVVRRDFGSAVAIEAARISVMPLERAGGQSQFIVHAPPEPDGQSLEPLLRELEACLHEPLTLDDVARRAALSVRTLSRRFREQTGTTPLQWLLRARVRRAQQLLETTGHSVESIATKVGFGSVTALREHFQRLLGTNPQAYRRAFRGSADVGESALPSGAARKRLASASL